MPEILFPLPLVKTSIWYGHETAKKHDAQIILTCYIVDIGSQKIDITGDDETNNTGWFTLSKLKNLKSLPMTVTIVEEIERLILGNHQDILRKIEQKHLR